MENKNRNVWIIVAIVVVLVCCLLAALAAGVAAWLASRISDSSFDPGFGFNRVVETQEMTFDVGAAPRLQIDNFAGNVRIRTGNEGLMSVEVSRRAGRSDVLRMIAVQPSQAGDTVGIRTMRTSDQLSNVAVDLEVTVPRGTRIDLTNGAGEVTIDGVEGEIVAHNGAGNVVVMGSQGQVRLDTGAGNIEYEGQPQGSSAFETGAGNIEVSLPTDFAGSVELDTGMGSVDLGGFDLEGSVSRANARGSIGRGGDAIIMAHTGAGDIDLVRR